MGGGSACGKVAILGHAFQGPVDPAQQKLGLAAIAIHYLGVAGHLGHGVAVKKVLRGEAVQLAYGNRAQNAVGAGVENVLGEFDCGAGACVHSEVEQGLGNALILDVVAAQAAPEFIPVKSFYTVYESWVMEVVRINILPA